jgi:hypothetical protein
MHHNETRDTGPRRFATEVIVSRNENGIFGLLRFWQDCSQPAQEGRSPKSQTARPAIKLSKSCTSCLEMR